MDLLNTLTSISIHDLLYICGIYIISSFFATHITRSISRSYSYGGPPHGPIVASIELTWEFIKIDIILGFLFTFMASANISGIAIIISLILKFIIPLILFIGLIIYGCTYRS